MASDISESAPACILRILLRSARSMPDLLSVAKSLLGKGFSCFYQVYKGVDVKLSRWEIGPKSDFVAYGGFDLGRRLFFSGRSKLVAQPGLPTPWDPLAESQNNIPPRTGISTPVSPSLPGHRAQIRLAAL